MSKEDVWNLLSNDKNGKAMADKLLAYGDALVNAGLIDQNKYRDSKGNVAIKPKDKSGGSSAINASGWALHGSGSAKSLEKSLRELVESAHLKSKA